MLTELQIENLGVIDRCQLVLGGGLTAFTGETGAGKTMLIEAIELLAGGRADSSVVRHGADEARVEGRFVDGDGVEHVLARVIPAVGRSRSYVDGHLATVGSLGELLADIVDLHGQHAHQRLLSTATQRAALDRFGDIDLTALRAARARLTEIDAALAALGGDERARAREIDLLRYQVGELDSADISGADEDIALDTEESVLADAQAHRDAGRAAHLALSDDAGAREWLATALSAVDGRSPFASQATRLRDLLADVDDLIADFRDTADVIEESPERLAEIRERRQVLADLRRKYGHDLAAVIAFHAEAQERLAELEHYDRRAEQLDHARTLALRDEAAAAAEVGAARRAAAPVLAAAVEARLRDLAMPHASIAITVGEHDTDHPGDRVQFLLSANPGGPLLPLNRVASGGELARTMLALRLALLSGAHVADPADPGADDTPATLVFDEVDAGIGGAAAHAVAAALHALGRHHQVLVVTHLAQVAAVADRQLAVSKSVLDDSTFTLVEDLDHDRRVDEVARMLSGSATTSAREHARELLA